MKTLICLILDRSGSMSGKENDVIGGVNTFIDEQKKLPDEAVISLVRFDNQYENFRPAHDLAKAEHLAAADYVPRGSTALLDAIGRTLNALDSDWKQHQPEKAIVVIVTDGYENASVEFQRSQIKDMIEAREKSGKWTFVYLGANVDAFAEAGSLGIGAMNTSGYTGSSKGTRHAFAATSNSVGALRGGALNAGLGGQLGEDDDEDDAKNQPQPAPAPAAVTAPISNKPAWQEPGKAWQPPA